MSAWTLEPIEWRDGIAAEMKIRATRKCGRTETISVWQWPSGWRLGRRSTAPMSVQREAIRLAKEIMTPA